jgi:Ala-tRNA(Pro) deacylase
MSDGPSQVYSALDALGIVYTRYDHPPVFTGEDAALHWADIPARGMKNLFLRNKKGDRHYLVILPIEKQADLRRLVKLIGDDRFSFASPDRLAKHLGLTPGSVSPFGLLNNPSHSVQVIVDTDLRGASLPDFYNHMATLAFMGTLLFVATSLRFSKRLG